MSEVIELSQHKAKTESIFNMQRATADIQKYGDVVMKSVKDFHTFSVQEKVDLYSSLAAFNIEILRQLLEYKKGEMV